MTVEIREAAREDIPGVLRLYHQLTLRPEHYRDPAPSAVEAAVRELERRDDVTLLVAVRDGAVAGSLVLAVVPNLSYGARPWAVIENMVVDEAVRRGGVGRALIDDALRRAREAGCYKVELQSRAERTWAHAFYEAAGFRPLATGYKLYFDGSEPRS